MNRAALTFAAMTKLLALAGSGLALALLATSPLAAQQEQPATNNENTVLPTAPSSTSDPSGPLTLWQDLAFGMTPQKALPFIQELEGVRKARLYRRRDADDSQQIRISYSSNKIPIAGMGFEIEPRFRSLALDQVWLASTGQCSNNALATFDQLSHGLQAKYPQVIYETGMRRSDIARANRDALQSGGKVTISHIYGSAEVVVVLTFAFSVEARPPHPGYSSRLMRTLWQIALSEYETRKSECAGTGDKRMDVALQYMTRAAFDEQAQATAEDMVIEQQELIDQL